MKKKIVYLSIILTGLSLIASCGKRTPYERGVEAGKAACECYQLEGLEAVENCIENIEKENSDLLNDTVYLKACEEQMFNCITNGIVDIDKPLKEVSEPKAKDTTDHEE